MFGLIAALSLSLALTRVNFLIGGCAMLAYVLIVSLVDRDALRKRSLIYGAVSGVMLFMIVAFIVASLRGEWPVTSYFTPDTTFRFARQYAFPIGGFGGAVVGCMFADVQKSRQLPNGDA